MLTKLVFKHKHRCFKEGDELTFRPGVNLLVGDQGVGKSTLLNVISGHKREICDFTVTQRCSTRFFDAEKMNPRVNALDTWNADRFKGGLFSRFESHGEVQLRIVEGTLDATEFTVFMCDELDMALSVKSCVKLAKAFQKLAQGGHQIIASVHNIVVLSFFDEVLNVKTRQWEPTADFVESLLNKTARKKLRGILK